MEIIDTEQLKAYLVANNVSFKSLERLSGGSTNFVWRMIEDNCHRSMIIKHAEPYVAASAGRMQYPVDRMDLENRALKTLSEQLAKSGPVKLPEVYQYDSENHALMLEDGGPRTLKEAYADPSLDIPMAGKHLGKWLASFHQRTESIDVGDNKTAKAMYRFSYNHLADTLLQYKYDPALGRSINEQYGILLQTDDECVCHGDFWPGNVLVDGLRSTVVDWEMVRRGCGATDVGQFAAEAYLLDRFRGGRGLLPAFLSGYRAEKRFDERFIERVAVHMGVHLAFWPTRVAWGTEDETARCVEKGWDLLKGATGNDKTWIHHSLLWELL